MDTDALRLFARAADLLNISAAGRTLGLSPAAAGARLAKLEAELGVELLHRTTRKVSLSVDGGAFLPYAREIIAQEDAARAALGLRAPQATGTLRFSAPSTLFQRHIAPRIPAFLDARPGVSLDLRLSDTRFDLIDGGFDLALRNVRIEESSLKGRRLADDERVLCASPEYLAAVGAPEGVEDLTRHKIIAFRDVSPRPLISVDGRRAVFEPAAAGCRVVVDDGQSQRALTLAGAGVSMNSRWTVDADLASGRLVRVLPDFRVDDDAALWLVYPRSHALTAKVRVFIDFLVDVFARAPWRSAEA